MTAPAAMQFDSRDVTATLSRAGLGAAMLAFGWYQASDRFFLEDQAPWLALSIAGTLVAAASGVLWILGLRRGVSLRVAEVKARIAELPMAAAEVLDDEAALVVLTTGGARLYHRADCALVLGRPATPTTEALELVDGRQPCGACLDV